MGVWSGFSTLNDTNKNSTHPTKNRPFTVMWLGKKSYGRWELKKKKKKNEHIITKNCCVRKGLMTFSSRIIVVQCASHKLNPKLHEK